MGRCTSPRELPLRTRTQLPWCAPAVRQCRLPSRGATRTGRAQRCTRCGTGRRASAVMHAPPLSAACSCRARPAPQQLHTHSPSRHAIWAARQARRVLLAQARAHQAVGAFCDCLSALGVQERGLARLQRDAGGGVSLVFAGPRTPAAGGETLGPAAERPGGRPAGSRGSVKMYMRTDLPASCGLRELPGAVQQLKGAFHDASSADCVVQLNTLVLRCRRTGDRLPAAAVPWPQHRGH